MSTVIQLDSGRKSFTLQRGESLEQWWYDIVELKLCFEELRRQHGNGTNEQSTALNGELIKALAVALSETYGLAGCTVDMAYQIYCIVNVQFSQLHHNITEQVRSIANGSTASVQSNLNG